VEASALRAPAGLSRISVASPLLRLRTDDQLVALFRMGNEDAFRVIYDRYRQRMFAYTRQMLAGSRSDAEDALQDVFLRAYGALRADGRPVTLRAWLYRVAHNRCIDQLRRPVPAPTDLFDVSRTPLHDPMLETEQREDLRRLVADVRRLPEQQRSALLMREMEGLSYAELADALNVSIPAVKSLLVRARIGLVEAIEARDTACCDIRSDLTAAHDRGVRVSGMAKRHLRECAGCRDYRGQLRGVQQGLGALSPSPSPLAALAKLLGIGGAGSGAAVGAGAGAGGGAVVGGGAAAATVTKVAAMVCCAAVVGTGAAEVSREMVHSTPTRAAQRSAAEDRSAPQVAPSPDRVLDQTARAATVPEQREAKPTASAPAPLEIAVDEPAAETIVGSDATPFGAGVKKRAATGGMEAPDEDAAEADGSATAGSDTTAAGGSNSVADNTTSTVLAGGADKPAATTGASTASGSGEASSSGSTPTAASSDPHASAASPSSTATAAGSGPTAEPSAGSGPH